jgi:Tfp pilus assembly protein PilO
VKDQKELLGLIHTYVCGPMMIRVIGGYTYFIIFTDDHSKYDYVYLIKKTSINHLKNSKNSEMKLKNKLERVSKYFDRIEVVNT